MATSAAARIIADRVGLLGSFWDDTQIDRQAREAAEARRYKDWPEDLNWRTDPEGAADKITMYLDSFAEND